MTGSGWIWYSFVHFDGALLISEPIQLLAQKSSIFEENAAKARYPWSFGTDWQMKFAGILQLAVFTLQRDDGEWEDLENQQGSAQLGWIE